MSTRRLPMFPLGTVLFPYAVLPLHVFEPRYRMMTRRCLEGDGEFGVVLIERGSEVGGGDTRCNVGTIARIVQASEQPDGRYALVTTGVQRFRVAEWLPDDPYPQAEIEPIDDEPAVEGDAAAREEAVTRFGAVLELWRQLDPRIPAVPPPIANEPVRAAYELAAIAPIGPFDAQQVLQTPSAGERLAQLSALLDDRAVELRARIALEGGQ